MAVAIVTGSGGLVGSETVEHLVRTGYRVVGLENDMRAAFFGPGASTRPVTERLVQELPELESLEVDIRDADAVEREVVVHAAAQPSHDWAASDPSTDFGVNANGR